MLRINSRWQESATVRSQLRVRAIRCVLLTSLLCVGSACSLLGQQIESVQPSGGKVGTVLRVHGLNLGKQKIESIYLSDQTLDMMAKVLSQTDDLIELRIPPSVKPGKLQLVLKTTGKEPRLLEQPFYVKVEETAEKGEVATASK